MRVTATKLKMRGPKPVPQQGYVPIFPNNKHAHAFSYKDSFDCSSLSPMQLGPVKGALLLENYYQFAKVYEDELSEENCECGNVELGPHKKPGPKFFAARHKAYNDPTPHRHKSRGPVPVYSWYGEGMCCTYIQSRYHYCTHYVELASTRPAFARLQTLEQVEIFGYDAFTPTEPLLKHYLDPSRPFGHELVLVCMLRGEEPWNDRAIKKTKKE